MLSHGDVALLSAPPDGITCVKPGGRSYVQHTAHESGTVEADWFGSSDLRTGSPRCHFITELHVNGLRTRSLTEP